MGVLVLGMHRSGTSVAARAVNLLGVPFGGGRLVPPTADNPGGHWESWELQDVNNLLLEHLGGSWSGPPDLEPGWETKADLDSIRDEARSAWGLVHPRDPWLWKDPRTCITLPFWRSVADLGGPAVVIYRDPAGVVGSLARRDGFSPAVSAALWERYNRDVLMGISGWPVLVAPYGRLLREPSSWLNQVREFLAGHGVPVGGRDQVEAAAASVNMGKPPSSFEGAGGMEHGKVAEQERLLCVLRDLEGVHDEWTVPDLGPASPGLGRLLEEHHFAFTKQRALESELARARSQLGHVINRTRVKVLAYRAYQRSPLMRRDPATGQGPRRVFGRHAT
jgi:hypothetical protein